MPHILGHEYACGIGTGTRSRAFSTNHQDTSVLQRTCYMRKGIFAGAKILLLWFVGETGTLMQFPVCNESAPLLSISVPHTSMAANQYLRMRFALALFFLPPTQYHVNTFIRFPNFCSVPWRRINFVATSVQWKDKRVPERGKWCRRNQYQSFTGHSTLQTDDSWGPSEITYMVWEKCSR